MAVESAADRAVFFNSDEHAVEAAYTLAAGGASETVDGILDNEHLAVDVDAGVAVSSSDPRFQCDEGKLPVGYGADDTLVINSTTYKARDFEPDGTGLVFVVLEEQ